MVRLHDPYCSHYLKKKKMFQLVLSQLYCIKMEPFTTKEKKHQHYEGVPKGFIQLCLFSFAGSCWWYRGTRPFQPGSGRFDPESDRWGSARWSG